jgi:hypothetical protein
MSKRKKRGEQSLGFHLHPRFAGSTWPPSLQEALDAAVIIQLGIARPPSARDVVELAMCPLPEQQHIKALLARLNRRLPDRQLDKLTAAIHIACSWAAIYRKSSGMRRSRSDRRKRIQSWDEITRPKRELLRLVRACNNDDLCAFAQIVAALSPCALDLLMHAAVKRRIPLNATPYLLCRECVGRAASAAIEDDALDHRLPEIMRDRAVATVAAAYRAATGEPGGRTTREGRPAGPLHALLLAVSEFYGIPLVTRASDHRIRHTIVDYN